MRLQGRGLLAAGVAIVAILVGAVAGGSALARGGGTLVLRPVADFNNPMYVAFAPGDSQHMWVLERPGVVKVVNRNGSQERTVIDISSRVATEDDSALMGIAFPPNYQQSHRFYLDYSEVGTHDIIIDEYRTTAASPYHAAPSTRRQVIHIIHRPGTDHYGGTILFGPDGHLYISTGDGGCCGDPYDKARHLNNLLGKILRIDPLPANGHPYTIPSSNPFVGENGKDEIYSYGLRNPFRFSIDAKTNRIAIGDVGQDQWEEVDYTTLAAAKGANFGWPEFEGTHSYDPSRPALGTPVDPIFEYPHGDPGGGAPFGCAVIGGDVVRSPDLPSLAGQYVYTDNCTGEIRAFTPRLTGAVGEHDLGLNAVAPSAFGVGPSGQIYVASLGGTVYHLAETP
jgi:glucose/arabinose dehydrogenase